MLAAGPFGYEADIRLDVEGLPSWRVIAKRAAFVRRAIAGYDVIHLNFGHPIVAVRRGPLRSSASCRCSSAPARW